MSRKTKVGASGYGLHPRLLDSFFEPGNIAAALKFSIMNLAQEGEISFEDASQIIKIQDCDKEAAAWKA